MIDKQKEDYNMLLNNFVRERYKKNFDGDVQKAMEYDYLINGADFYVYKKIFEDCVKRGIKKVYDIGACSGVQSNVILYENLPLEYVAIELGDIVQIHNNKCIHASYPLLLNPKKDEALVSHLCLGYFNFLVKKDLLIKSLNEFSHLYIDLPMQNYKQDNSKDNNCSQIKNEKKNIRKNFFAKENMLGNNNSNMSFQNSKYVKLGDFVEKYFENKNFEKVDDGIFIYSNTNKEINVVCDEMSIDK